MVLLFKLMLEENIVKISFKIHRWQRYHLYNLAPFRGKVAWRGLPLKSQNAEACICVDTGFLLVMLFSCLEFYNVSKKWRIRCTWC